MCGIGSLLDLMKFRVRALRVPVDLNDADQPHLGLPPIPSAHGPWRPIGAQAWVPSPCPNCAACPQSLLAHKPLGPVLQPCLQSRLQPCLLLLLPGLSGWAVDGPCCQQPPLPTMLGCCRTMPWSVRTPLGWGHPWLLAHSPLGEACPRCSLTIWDRTEFFPCFQNLLCDLYVRLRKEQRAEQRHIRNAQYSRERQSTRYWDLEPACDNTVPGKPEADERENQDNPLNL